MRISFKVLLNHFNIYCYYHFYQEIYLQNNFKSIKEILPSHPVNYSFQILKKLNQIVLLKIIFELKKNNINKKNSIEIENKKLVEK